MQFEIIDLEQGSQEWKDFRKGKVGSSDSATINNLNPHDTPYKLWKRFMDGTEIEENEAMREGKRLEPVARKLLCRETGITFLPIVTINKERKWQIASLDGANVEQKILAEIKCGGKNLYDKALAGEIPPYYLCQIQHQLDVTGFEKALYVCYYQDRIKILEVYPESSFIKDMRDNEEKFWRLNLMQKEPPDLSEKDYEIYENAKSSEKLAEYLAWDAKEKESKRNKDALKEEILSDAPSRNFILDGVKFLQKQNTSYDMKEMRADGIDVDSYKKFSMPYWMISAPRKSA